MAFDREALRRSYERSAATYDVQFRELQRAKYAGMLEKGADLGRGPWLDLGCGTGLLRAHLAEIGCDPRPLIGLDFSRAMLARGSSQGLPVAQGVLEVLPFRRSAFSAVLAFTTLRILEDPDAERRTLAEVARVLEPDGVFVLTVLETHHDASLVERLHLSGFRAQPPLRCGQDIGYRCVRA